MVAEHPERLPWGPGSSFPETAVEPAMLRGKALGERVGAVIDGPPAPLPLPLLVTAQETVMEKTGMLTMGSGAWCHRGLGGAITCHFPYFLV